MSESNETPQAVSAGLADYQCYKIVKAGRIVDVDKSRRHLVVELADGSHEIIDVTLPGTFLKSNRGPNVGDYFVVYEDGYESWSSQVAFEEGYSRIPADSVMTDTTAAEEDTEQHTHDGELHVSNV